MKEKKEKEKERGEKVKKKKGRKKDEAKKRQGALDMLSKFVFLSFFLFLFSFRHSLELSVHWTESHTLPFFSLIFPSQLIPFIPLLFPRSFLLLLLLLLLLFLKNRYPVNMIIADDLGIVYEGLFSRDLVHVLSTLLQIFKARKVFFFFFCCCC